MKITKWFQKYYSFATLGVLVFLGLDAFYSGIFYSISPLLFFLETNLLSTLFLDLLLKFIRKLKKSRLSSKKNLTDETQNFDEKFFNNWLITQKEEELWIIFLRRGLSYFWYLFVTTIFLYLLGLSISSFSPSEDVFDNFNFRNINTTASMLDYWANADNFQRVGLILSVPTFTLFSWFLIFPAVIFMFLNCLNFFNKKATFSPFSFQDSSEWIEKTNFKKGIQRNFVKEELLHCKRRIFFFNLLSWLFMILAAIGTFLAIKFDQGGNMLGVTSVIGSQLSSSGKERNQSVKGDLQKNEKILNQEFLSDFLCSFNECSEEAGIKSAFLENLENENHSVWRVIKKAEKSKDKEQFIISNLRAIWDENLDNLTGNLWGKLNNYYYEKSKDKGKSISNDNIIQEQAIKINSSMLMR